MAEYIDREDYCKNLCHCHNEYCDKESCPIWKAPAADVAPVADEVEKLRKERDAAVADIQGVMRNAADTCYRCKHRFGDSAAECCINCEDGSNWEWRGVVDE